MKKASIFFIITLFALFLAPKEGFSQSTNSDQQNGSVMYISSDDITIEKFYTLKIQLKSNTDFSIKEVCVPAKVISIRWSSNIDIQQAFSQISPILADADIKQSNLLPNFTDDKFLQKCSNARSVN